MTRMSGQDTLERRLPVCDGAWHAMLCIEAGKMGLTGTRHGMPDRWDWGVTLDSLLNAQADWTRDDKELRELTPSQRIDLFAHQSAVALRLRKHWSRTNRISLGTYAGRPRPHDEWRL